MLDQAHPDGGRFVADAGSMSLQPTIITSSYWTPPPGFALVRTSHGKPKDLPDLPVLTSAIPTWQVRHLAAAAGGRPPGQPAMFEACEYADTDWREMYELQLCDNADRLIAELDRLAEEHDAIALGCFERQASQCHRQVLGQWLRGHGIHVAVIA